MPSDRVPVPQATPGIAWWQQPLWLAIEGKRNEMPLVQTRPMCCESIFSGVLTEAYGDAGLGMQTIMQLACDRKPAAIKFIRRNHKDVRHLYTDAEQVAKGDFTSCKMCGASCHGPELRPDLMRLGPPCQPFSRCRTKSGSGQEGPPRDHAHFETCFVIAKNILMTRRPRGFILEEVLGFADKDKDSGKPFVLVFQEEVASLGYTTRCVTIDVALRGQVGRPRLFVFGLTSELGGAQAADWLAEALDSVLRSQKLQKPMP
eukprot:3638592-Lingulodinium_polyedra.AAC.1